MRAFLIACFIVVCIVLAIDVVRWIANVPVGYLEVWGDVGWAIVLFDRLWAEGE